MTTLSFFGKISKFFDSIFPSKKPDVLEIETVKDNSLKPYEYISFYQDTELVKNAVLPNYEPDSWKMTRTKGFINSTGLRKEHDLIYNIDNSFHMMITGGKTFGQEGYGTVTKSIAEVIDYKTYIDLCEEYDYFNPDPVSFPDLYKRQPKYSPSLVREKIVEFRKLDQMCVPFASRTLSIGQARQANFEVYHKLGYITKEYDKLYPTLIPGEMYHTTRGISPGSTSDYFQYSASKILSSVTTDRMGAEDATNGVPNLDSLIPLKADLKAGSVIMYIGSEKLNDFLAMRSFTATWLIEGKIVNAIIPITCIEKLCL